MAEILEKMITADVIVMATSVYFYTMDAQMKTLIDRTVFSYSFFTLLHHSLISINKSRGGSFKNGLMLSSYTPLFIDSGKYLSINDFRIEKSRLCAVS
ncbi:hypothetical protein SBF1_1620024 [Candidatus Desulfosporosinus infrequens]|uniref:NADPH-dependent FMN reductase-like domain-containing protein n=1 Tax=Candidatus Desulfosporosinus infrequens TaxID=2043169 RepID=A0A2U3KA13_9FIRM|nr:hypothetical protein SBF1_1620024 [Candidatus Desulfosporosinus infrequens]